jgi:hypothetical protein
MVLKKIGQKFLTYSFLLLFDPGSEIRDPDPGSGMKEKSIIQDKHPGPAALVEKYDK